MSHGSSAISPALQADAWAASLLKRRDLLLLLPAVLMLLIGFVWPLLEVTVWSFLNEARAPTLENYSEALAPGAYRIMLLGTLQLSGGVAVACILLGYPVAYLLASLGETAQRRWLILILFPMWVSVLIRTYGWIVVLGREGVVNSLALHLNLVDQPLRLLYTRGAVYIAMIQVLLPVAILIMFAAMSRLNPRLVMAARVLGASPARAFFHVYLPLSLNGVQTALILTFVLALGFFITPALVGGPEDLMISNAIETQINKTLNWGFGSALAISLLVSGLVIVALLGFLLRRFGAASHEGGVK
jgi:putative spermidine/putrescine transport system permease protein